MLSMHARNPRVRHTLCKEYCVSSQIPIYDYEAVAGRTDLRSSHSGVRFLGMHIISLPQSQQEAFVARDHASVHTLPRKGHKLSSRFLALGEALIVFEFGFSGSVCIGTSMVGISAGGYVGVGWKAPLLLLWQPCMLRLRAHVLLGGSATQAQPKT